MTARAELVGFRRQEDLAKAVGCTRERIVRWSAMEKPPRRMRKGFGESLTRALKTTRQKLFVEYVNLRPEDATVVWAGWGIPYPWEQEDWQSRPDESKLQSLMVYVGRENLARFVDIFLLIAKARQDIQRAEEIATHAAHPIDHPDIPPLPAEAVEAVRRYKSPKT